MMNRVYIAILSILQFLTAFGSLVYVIKVLLGGSAKMSLIIAIPLVILGVLLGSRNVIKLKGMLRK